MLVCFTGQRTLFKFGARILCCLGGIHSQLIINSIRCQRISQCDDDAIALEHSEARAMKILLSYSKKSSAVPIFIIILFLSARPCRPNIDSPLSILFRNSNPILNFLPSLYNSVIILS